MNLFLHFDSHSPLSQKKSIFITQLQKITSFCTNKKTRQSLISNLFLKFQNRKYPKHLLNLWQKQLTYNKNQRNTSKIPFMEKGIPLILPYKSTKHKQLTHLIQNISTLLKDNYPNIKNILSLTPILIYINNYSLNSLMLKHRKL